MSEALISIRELHGWGFDEYEYRPDVPDLASELLSKRRPFERSNAVMPTVAEELEERFASLATRQDLISEMSGLTWSLGLVDLRTLIAFQRRVAFSPDIGLLSAPPAGDWHALLEISFGSPKPIDYELFHDHATRTVTLLSSNPNLHIRFGGDPIHPLSVHGGGPFFEVGRLRDRWFLRDGYHRAYALLQAQVFAVPAVIVEASTMTELGANEPWFFSEDVLFSKNPPMVADFLNEELTLKYQRPPFIKTVQIKIEESFKPAAFTGE